MLHFLNDLGVRSRITDFLIEGVESPIVLMHNWSRMCAVTTFPACLALVTASFVAPYQHIHLSVSGHHHSDREVVHIHLYAISVPTNVPGVNDNDGIHISRPLDTFLGTVQATFLVFALAGSFVFGIAPEKSLGRINEFIEPRGHDPPVLDASIPRAPPA